MQSPKKYCYNILNFTNMRTVELKISKVSEEVLMGKCPEYMETNCGIMYRAQ